VSEFITARAWRKLGTDDALKSVEVAAGVIQRKIEGEGTSGKEVEEVLGRIMQLLDISARFRAMAVGILAELQEEYAHL